MVVGLVGGALLIMPPPWRLRLLGLPLPLLAPPVPRPDVGEFEVVAADIGHGTAVLLRTRNHLLLYDAGPRYTAETDATQRVLLPLPLLRSRGEGRIDLLMLSHRHIDHLGGAATPLAQWPVTALSSSLPDSHPLLVGNVPHRRCTAGQAWDWDGVRFEPLHPHPAFYQPSARSNTLSCVLRGQDSGGRGLLLSGDIEAAPEAALVERFGCGLRSQVLLVPHHGCRTSSSEAFIGALASGTALVQAAERSCFGHPRPRCWRAIRRWAWNRSAAMPAAPGPAMRRAWRAANARATAVTGIIG
jgi:competence protein ComEC